MPSLVAVAAVALALLSGCSPDNAGDAWDATKAPPVVESALAGAVGVPYTVMVSRPNDWGWVCGSVTTPGRESRFFVWDGSDLTVQPDAPADPTPDQAVALAMFMQQREGCFQ
jgi:hypothetical protein